jgi:AcrR family transcriptional regulator
MISASRKSSSALGSPSRITPDAATDGSEKRGRILEAAQSLFLRYGIKRTSVDDVAREAGIAKGTVYLYFDSKAAIFAALAERLCAGTLSEAQAILDKTEPFVERLVDVLDCYIGKTHRVVSKSPHVAELVSQAATSSRR